MGAFDPVGTSGSLDAFVRRLMTLEQRPLQRLQSRRGDIESKRTALSELSTKLSALRAKVFALSAAAGVSPLYRFESTSSDADDVAATAGPGGVEGTYSVTVTKLAAAHAQASQEYTYADTSFTAGQYVFDITIGSTTEQVTVTIASGADDETVLNTIADAVNLSGAEVVASVTTTDDTAGQGKLVFRSRSSGTANQMTSITDVTGNLISSLTLSQTQAAADADVTVDGVQVISSSNTIKNAIPGVTLTVKGTVATPVTIEVSGDSKSIKTALEDFIAVYNAAIDEVRTQLAGDLKGESPIIASLPRNLTGAVLQAVGTIATGEIDTLIELGISIDAGGKLSLSDATRLEEAVEQHGVTGIATIFNDSTDGVARRLEDLLDDQLGAQGTVGLVREGLDRRVKLLDRQIAREQERVVEREQQVRRQLASMQDLVTRLAAQSSLASSFTARILR